MVRSADTTSPLPDRDTVFALATSAELLARMLLANEDVGEAAGAALLEQALAVKQGLGIGAHRPRQAPDRDGLEEVIAGELQDAGADGLTITEAVDRLWADFADHYAHQGSLRKAIYEVLKGMVDDGIAHGANTGKRGGRTQGARYYAIEHAPGATNGHGETHAASA